MHHAKMPAGHLVLFLFRSEYVKVFNGNGTQVFVRQGCGWNSNLAGTLLQIPFEESRNVTIQVSLKSASSYVKIDYGILSKGLNSGKRCKSNFFFATLFYSSVMVFRIPVAIQFAILKGRINKQN